MPEKLGAYSGGIRAATSQFSGAGEGGPNQLAFEAAVTNDAYLKYHGRLYKQAIYSLSYDINNKDILSDVIAGLELEQHNGRR